MLNLRFNHYQAGLHQEHLLIVVILEREMPLIICIVSHGMVFVLLLGHLVHQLVVAYNILGASTMSQFHKYCCYIIIL